MRPEGPKSRPKAEIGGEVLGEKAVSPLSIS